MKNLKRFTLSLAAILLFSGVAMVLPATAEHGGTDTTTTSSNDSAVADNTSTTDSTSQSSSETEINNLTEHFREVAKENLQAARENHKEQSQEHRKQSCEARKANLERRMSNSVRFATNHKAVFDKIYQRVQDFYTAKKLNVSNYDALKAAVDSASTDAQTSIDALKALDASNIDCTSQTVADSVSAFQVAVKDTRDKLKAYRAALVDLIKSLKGASTGANTTSGTDNNSTDTTNSTNTTNQ